MMKRFFIGFLSSLAAVWVSVILLMFLGIFFIAGLISNAMRGSEISPRIAKESILYIDLAANIEEINPNVELQSLLNGSVESSLILQPTVDAIKAAETDPRIKGIFIDAQGVSSGLASLKTLGDAIDSFRQNTDKWIVAYGDQVTQGSYYLASMADELYLNPQGMLDIHGLSATVVFYKNLLQKLGVEVQVLKVGTFKSAVEPYILDSVSEPNRLQMKEYMGVLWNDIASTMAKNRDMSLDSLNLMADSMLLTVSPEELVNRGLVDKLCYRHEVEDRLRELVNVDDDDPLPLVNVADYAFVAREKMERSAKNKIAVLYAVGEITESGETGITSDRLVPMILDLAENDEIRGLVLRVNSPGGSAYASEQIWEALETFKKSGKKFYVSMGDVAASGGYYISCGADKIYASPLTLTGSIGIFGLVPNLHGLLTDHLGINVQSINTNANGNFPSFTQPMTPFQQASMQNMINRGYETFVGRCAEGRSLSVDSIKQIAEGRVWAGRTALEIGLVDELGTLDQAIVDLAADLNISNYSVESFPRFTPTIADFLRGMRGGVYEATMRRFMGEEAYEIYRKARRIEEIDGLQCRMEDIIVTL